MEFNEEVSAYEQKIKFIMGHAGTGKSTLLAKAYKRMPEHTIVITPTHKAGKVLQGKGITNTRTAHSILKLVPSINMSFDPRKNQKIDILRQMGERQLAEVQSVIIDEFSMLNTEMLDMLLEALPDEAEVTIYGDPFQLPPVKGTPIAPYYYTNDITTLTTQHRADNPEIVETFERFVKWLETRDNSISLKVDMPHYSLDKALQRYNFDPEQDIILAYTNNKVLGLNSIAAEYMSTVYEGSHDTNFIINDQDVEIYTVDELYGDKEVRREVNSDKPPIFPNCISKGEFMEDDKLVETVLNTLKDIEKYNTDIPYPKSNVHIPQLGDVYSVYYDTDWHNTHKRLREEVEDIQAELVNTHTINTDEISIKDWCRNNNSDPLVRKRGKAWSQYLSHQSLVFNLRKPYARTVHKAQGAEYRTVFIAQDDIKMTIRGGNYEAYARLMYVALSRAIKNVVIVD